MQPSTTNEITTPTLDISRSTQTSTEEAEQDHRKHASVLKPSIFLIEQPSFASLHNADELARLVESHIFETQNTNVGKIHLRTENGKDNKFSTQPPNSVKYQTEDTRRHATASQNPTFKNKFNQKLPNSDEYDDASLKEANTGQFGAKLNAKYSNKHNRTNQQVFFRRKVPSRTTKPPKFTQTTNKLISGQDVLNINEAINKDVNNIIADESSHVTSGTSSSESTTTIAYLTERPVTTPQLIQENTGDPNANIERYVTPTPVPITVTHQVPYIVTENSENVGFLNQPIIVIDDEPEQKQDSSNAQTVNILSAETRIPGESSGQSTILVTPRPISTNFLAPITAGVQLQSVDQSAANSKYEYPPQTYIIEVQKSLPYYIGKFEYTQNPSEYGAQKSKEVYNETVKTEQAALENYELGMSLINFPVPSLPFFQEVRNEAHPVVQQLPSENINQKFSENDDSHELNSLNLQQLPSTIINTKFIDPLQNANDSKQSLVYRKSVESSSKQNQLVSKPAPAPVVTSQSIEQIHIPIQIPYEITKYIDRPYPVQVPIPQPYPVEKVVEKIVKQPYPVEVRIPVQVPIRIPHPVPVERIVEKKVPITHIVEKPFPVEKVVEKPVPQYIPKPYPVEVKVPVPVAQPYYIQVPIEVPRPFPLSLSNYFPRQYSTPQGYHVKVPQYLPFQVIPPQPVHTTPSQLLEKVAPRFSENIDQKTNEANQVYTRLNYVPAHMRNYWPPVGVGPYNGQDQEGSYSTQHGQYKQNFNNYIGLVPPRVSNTRNNLNHNRIFRNARSNFGKNLKIEYGFLPPLIPSLEIDEHGNPIHKDGET